MFFEDPSSRARTCTWSSWTNAVFSTIPWPVFARIEPKNRCHSWSLKVNQFTFSDQEWQRFFGSILANTGQGIVEKTALVQEDHVQVLARDDGSSKNIYLIDKVHIHNNRLQVINQYEVPGNPA